MKANNNTGIYQYQTISIELRENKNVYIPRYPIRIIRGYVLGIIRKDVLTKGSKKVLDYAAHMHIRLKNMAIIKKDDVIAEIDMSKYTFDNQDQVEFNIVDAGNYYVAIYLYYKNFLIMSPLLYNPSNPYVNYEDNILSNPPTLGSLLTMYDKENRYIYRKAKEYYTVSHIGTREMYYMLRVAFAIKGFSIFEFFRIDDNYLVEAFYKACIERAHRDHEAYSDYRTPPGYYHVLELFERIQRRRESNGSIESRIRE